MSDKDDNGIWSPTISALFSETSLSLFDEKAKKCSVKLHNKNKNWKKNEYSWFDVSEELNKKELMALSRELNSNTPSSPITTMLDIDEFEKYGYNPLSETVKYIHCKNCGRVVLQTVFYKHVKICNQLKDDDLSTSKEVHEKKDDFQNVFIKQSKKRHHFDADSDSSTLEDSQKVLKTDKYDYKDKNEFKKFKSKNIFSRQKSSIDLEKQCGVLLPNGNLCSRSLTCKSHSMGAKRSVPGRSLPYDILLVHYQKKNQIKQQKTVIMSSAFDDYASDVGQVDSDEEVTLVMESISCISVCPLEKKIMIPVRRKRRFFRFQEMFSIALCQGLWPGKIQGSVNGIFGKVVPFYVNSDSTPDENSQSSTS
ncbi:hypothetical protein PORY_000601 [Pneumocystis oryctolagi]|uniref:Uncharacterized protein n=1 Tax=Pneumocystis oryctolagi TaxID=42067 RepID=A0ACB7CDG9_9ASCO|nr:hypothetical protein PORY_000601 [Pneumocystis oryctolagi]